MRIFILFNRSNTGIDVVGIYISYHASHQNFSLKRMFEYWITIFLLHESTCEVEETEHDNDGCIKDSHLILTATKELLPSQYLHTNICLKLKLDNK